MLLTYPIIDINNKMHIVAYLQNDRIKLSYLIQTS